MTESSSENADGYTFLDVTIKYFVKIVIALAVILPSVEYYTQVGSGIPLHDIFRTCIARSMCILTSACPCAIGLAIPSAVVAAVSECPNEILLATSFPISNLVKGAAQKKGVLLTKGSTTIEKLERTQCIIFDKTGTLTEAAIEVEDHVICSQWSSRRDDLLTLICALEEQDTAGHPIGKAIFRAGIKQLGQSWTIYKDLEREINSFSMSTRGVSGQVQLEIGENYDVVVGSLNYLQASSIPIATDLSFRSSRHGCIAVYVAVDGALASTLYLTVGS